MGKIHWAALAHSPWDHAGEPDFWQQLRAKALALAPTADRAIMVVVGCNLFEWGTFLRRIDNFLMDLLAEPAQVERLLDALLEIHLAHPRESLRRRRRHRRPVPLRRRPRHRHRAVHVARHLPPLFKPRHTLLCDYVHRHSSMHTFLHSCGSIHALLPDLIEAGFEIINPVQTACRDMEPERLKREFGRDVTFWGGGANTRAVLNHGTPAEVRDDVLDRLRVFAPGGGFVFNTIHNILPDVPPQKSSRCSMRLPRIDNQAGASKPSIRTIMKIPRSS